MCLQSRYCVSTGCGIAPAQTVTDSAPLSSASLGHSTLYLYSAFVPSTLLQPGPPLSKVRAKLCGPLPLPPPGLEERSNRGRFIKGIRDRRDCATVLCYSSAVLSALSAQDTRDKVHPEGSFENPFQHPNPPSLSCLAQRPHFDLPPPPSPTRRPDDPTLILSPSSSRAAAVSLDRSVRLASPRATPTPPLPP